MHEAGSVLSGEFSEKELEETSGSTATACGANIMDTGLQGDTIKLDMALLATYFLGFGEVGLWLVDESERPGSQVITGERSNTYVRWIREYSGGCPEKRSR